MTVQSLPSAMPTFPDLNGDPLTGGYVYVGEENLDPRQFPVSVFFDAALSIPAAQPLRTNAGFLVRNGAPTNIWMADGYHSLLVLDRNQRQVFYSPSWVGAKDTTLQDTAVDTFDGTGAPAIYTLSVTPGSKNATNIYVDGVYQKKSTYTLTGNQVSMTAAAGVGNVQIVTTRVLDYSAVSASIATELGALSEAVTQSQTWATAAEASRDAIDNRIYPGSYANDPTTRPDGSAIQNGDEYFNSTSNLRKRYNGSTWVASDINTANLAATSGASLVGFIGAGEGATAQTVQGALRGASLAEVTAAVQVVCWGDSLTAGTGGTAYPTALANISRYITTNQGVGGETSTQIKTRFLIDNPQLPIAIIWAGRNNYSDPTTVLADIAAMVADIGHGRYLVLTVLNGDYASEYSGQAGYNQIQTINSAILSTYGSRALDIRATLVAAYDAGIPQDVTDHGRDVVPSSLRSDQIHLNTAGYALVASTIKTKLESLTFDGKLLTTENVGNVFKKVKTDEVRLGTKHLYLAGDGVTWQTDAELVPQTTGTQKFGTTALRWGDAFFSTVFGSAYYLGSSQLIDAVGSYTAAAGNVDVLSVKATTYKIGATKQITLSGTGLHFQFNAHLVPTANNTYDLGIAGTAQWANAYLSGFLQAALLIIGSAQIRSGTGSPEGVMPSPVGSIYLRTDGGAGTTFYVKESGGSGNTGWVAK